MLTPPFLKPDDIVGVVAPAAKPEPMHLRAGCDVIESWGLTTELGKHTLDEQNSYLSATDEKRLKDLQIMLDRPDISAIYCARGGYGTARIVDRIDFRSFLKKPKWIIGFSDITVLHLKIHKMGVESIHACVPVQFDRPEYRTSIDSIKSLLLQSNSSKISAKPHQFNKKGRVQGQLVGGNLSLVVDALGTSTSLDTVGKILVLEETGEPLYKIDRMITQLKRAGKLDKLAGLVLGHILGTKATQSPFDETFEAIVTNKIPEHDYPVAFDFPIGHMAPNFPWRYSAKANLVVTSRLSEILY